MQSLNNDMDELMRKAAADYPVRPQGADWDKVAQQLQASGVDEKENAYGGLKKLLFLLPFLLASFVCDRYLNYEHGNFKKLAVTNDAMAHASGSSYTGTRIVSNGAEPVVDFKTQNSGEIKHVSKTENSIIQNRGKSQSIFISSGFSNSMGISKSLASAINQFPSQVRVIDHESGSAFDLSNRTEKEIIANTKIVLANVGIPIPVNKKPKAEKPIEKGYVSFIGGPDVSRVKGQRVESIGYSIGILGGYNFGKRWTIETGLLWDHKAYYSKGQYFNTKKLYLPEHSEIVYVDGFCEMFEIPVHLRYSLLRKGNYSLAISAGASSYLMQNEDYDYLYRRYNEAYAGNKKYRHFSKSWMSVGNVSLGYEHQVGQRVKIRLEPYFRIPIKGVGIGSLPISSTGVMVGITHPIK